MGTRTLTPREQNISVVEKELLRHKFTNFAGNMMNMFCSCAPVGPNNVFNAETCHKHVAESIVRAQNEWVRSQ